MAETSFQAVGGSHPLPGGFPDGASGKELSCQCRRSNRRWFNPWVGKIPWRRAGSPLQYSCLRILRTEEGGLVRRVTKTGARFHVTDFWGEVYTPRQASVLMVSWVSSRSVRAPPPARPTRGGPSLRLAFGSQYPHTHTHTPLSCWMLCPGREPPGPWLADQDRSGSSGWQSLGAQPPRTLLPGLSQLGLNEPRPPATTGAAPTSLSPADPSRPLGHLSQGPHVQGLQVGRPKNRPPSHSAGPALLPTVQPAGKPPHFSLGPSPLCWPFGWKGNASHSSRHSLL